MKDFIFKNAKLIIVEAGATNRLGEIVAKLGVNRVIIVTDQGIVKAGLLTRAVAGLKKAGLEVCTYEDVLADPPEKVVNEALTAAKEFKAEGVVGFGGGSTMDVAKLVAFLMGSAQSLTDLYGLLEASGPRLPLVQVPTTAGTGSEVTAISVLSVGENKKQGVSTPQLLPDVALLDAELTLGLPPHGTAATGVDAMVHAIEAYTSKGRKNPISDALAREAMRLLSANIRTAVAEGGNLEARSNMLLGALLAGQAFGNSTVGAMHAFAHVLGAHFHIPHGLGNSLVLPHVLRFNLANCTKEYAELAACILPDTHNCSDEVLADRFIEAIEALIADLGLETRLSQVGIEQPDLTMLAEAGMKEERILAWNAREMTYDDALMIFTQAF
jgi:alcohol dehydrogenase class IV